MLRCFHRSNQTIFEDPDATLSPTLSGMSSPSRQAPLAVSSFTAGARSFSLRKRTPPIEPAAPPPPTPTPSEEPVAPGPTGSGLDGEYKVAIQQLKYRVTAVEVLANQVPGLSRLVKSGLKDHVGEEVQRQLAQLPAANSPGSSSTQQGGQKEAPTDPAQAQLAGMQDAIQQAVLQAVLQHLADNKPWEAAAPAPGLISASPPTEPPQQQLTPRLPDPEQLAATIARLQERIETLEQRQSDPHDRLPSLSQPSSARSIPQPMLLGYHRLSSSTLPDPSEAGGGGAPSTTDIDMLRTSASSMDVILPDDVTGEDRLQAQIDDLRSHLKRYRSRAGQLQRSLGEESMAGRLHSHEEGSGGVAEGVAALRHEQEKLVGQMQGMQRDLEEMRQRVGAGGQGQQAGGTIPMPETDKLLLHLLKDQYSRANDQVSGVLMKLQESEALLRLHQEQLQWLETEKFGSAEARLDALEQELASTDGRLLAPLTRRLEELETLWLAPLEGRMEGMETIRMPPIEERLEHLEARRVAGLEGRLQGLESARVAPLEARVGTLETQAQLQHVTGDRDRLQLAEERINALFAEMRGAHAAASPGRGAGGAPRMARSLSDLRLDSLLGLEGPPERPLLHATMPEDEAGDRLRRLEAELQGHIATFREAHAALEAKIGDLGATLFKLQASVERPWAGGDRAPSSGLSSLKSSADSMPTGLRISSDSSAPSMRSSHGTVGRSSEGSGGLTGIEEQDEGQRRERPECTVEAVEAPDTPPRLSSEEKSPRTTLEAIERKLKEAEGRLDVQQKQLQQNSVAWLAELKQQLEVHRQQLQETGGAGLEDQLRGLEERVKELCVWVRQLERQQSEMAHFGGSGRRKGLTRDRQLEAAAKKAEVPRAAAGRHTEYHQMEDFDTVVVQDQYWEATAEDEAWLAGEGRHAMSSDHDSRLGSVWDSEVSE